MRRLIVNSVALLVIGLGGLTLSIPQNASATVIGSCESGWELQCDGNVCCTVCQDDGSIGECESSN
mgnify:CR=1 FL=1